jgi:aminocarboxymuconate-semialdehyde decarboxylase
VKVDIHTHILPEDWPDLRERYGYGGFIQLHVEDGCGRMMKDGELFREVDPDLWDPDTRLEDCARDSVDVQVISTVPVMFSYWAEPEDCLDLSIMLNDHIAQCVEKYPKRFIGLGTVPMQAPNLAAKELERCVKELGLAGIEIGTHVNNTNLDQPEFEPIWETAEKLGAAVFVHPWDMMGMEQLRDYWMPWLVSMPAETSRAICSLLMGGVLERYPKLRFAFAHGGGSFPATLGRISHGFDVRPDLCQVETTTPPREFVDKLYFDSLVHDAMTLDFLVDKVGADRLALGTDYPFPLGEHRPGKLVESTSYPPHVKERILSGSALEWLGRSRSDYETEASRAHSKSLGFDPSSLYD